MDFFSHRSKLIMDDMGFSNDQHIFFYEYVIGRHGIFSSSF